MKQVSSNGTSDPVPLQEAGTCPSSMNSFILEGTQEYKSLVKTDQAAGHASIPVVPKNKSESLLPSLGLPSISSKALDKINFSG
jgi:hypothetical protein